MLPCRRVFLINMRCFQIKLVIGGNKVQGVISFITDQLFNIFVGIFSLLIMLSIFIYQEWRERRQRNRETLRLTEEIVNILIRNCINNGISLSQVNLKALIDGFVLLKNCKLNCSLGELLMMVYAKVYENEHISKEVRPGLLKDIEGAMDDAFHYEPNAYVKYGGSTSYSAIIPFTSSILVALALFIIKFKNELQFGQSNEQIVLIAPLLIIGVILTVGSIFILTRNKLLMKLLDILGDIIYPRRKEIDNDSFSQYDKSREPINLSNEKPKKEVKLEQISLNGAIIMEMLEQKTIIEKLLRELYYVHFNERPKFPIMRIVASLRDENLINSESSDLFRYVFSNVNKMVHESEFAISKEAAEKITSSMKVFASEIYDSLEERRKKKVMEQTMETNKSA